MALQLILVFESDKMARTDFVYVNDVIKKIYKPNIDVTFQYIFLGGKTNYRKKNVLQHIKDLEKMFKPYGQSKIIYFIDADQTDLEYDKNSRNDNIQTFCVDNSYELVFFLKNIENVFWHKDVISREKRSYSLRFVRENQLKNIQVSDLSQRNPKLFCSNILLILDKYLSRNNE